MNRRFSVDFAILSMVLDAIVMLATIILATYFRPTLSFLPFVKNIPTKIELPILLYIALPLIWIIIFHTLSIYDGKRNIRFLDEISNLTFGSIIAFILQAGLLYLSYREISRFLFFFYVTLAYFGMTSWRIITRLVFRISKASTKKVLIIGTGTVGKQLQKTIDENPLLGLSVLGFIDDHQQTSNNTEILGSIKETHSIAHRCHVDHVVITLPSKAYEQINNLVAELHDLPLKIWVVPDYFRLALHKAVVEEFAGIPMFDLRAPALTDFQRLIKRIFDLLLSLFAIPIAILLTGLVAIAIKIEDDGPVFFTQDRVGENGKKFKMYKIRSMVPVSENINPYVIQTDDDGNIIHKIKDDPRTTKVGRFLRRTSLDEIPQLINVLKGEMSLVGPRPELPHLVDKYKLWQRERFTVPQGITGWWQINGRSDKPMHLNTQDDLYYVHNYSLLLDFYILLKTFWVVLLREGAY